MSISNEFFHQTVREWYDPLYRFALSLCRDPDDAGDLTQNTFYKFASKGDAITDSAKVKSWLFSVLHREFIDQYRRSRRHPNTSLELVAEPRSTSGISAVNRLDAQTMMRALGELDEKFRAPLTLFYLESFSYKEIAAVLDVPMGTVMSRLRRAKDQLRALVESGAGETSAEGKGPANSIPFPSKEANHG